MTDSPQAAPARVTLRMLEVAQQTGASLGVVKGWVASGRLACIRPASAASPSAAGA